MVNKTSLGKVSLWTSITGVVVLTLHPNLIRTFPNASGSFGLFIFAFCPIFSLLLEFAALGCGIAGRRTTAGKAGMIISSILILAVVSFVVLFFSGPPPQM
jgi:hypothetical protein